MPFAKLHSARIRSPGQFEDIRTSPDHFGAGIDVLFGINKVDGESVSKVQSIRFDKDRFTVAQAREWLRNNDFDPILFEPATEPMREAHISEAVLSFQDLPLADRGREWDGAAARRRVRAFATSDGEVDIDRYRRAFVLQIGDRENLTSYKLGIADVIGGRLQAVPRGIFAAAGVLQGARGGVDAPQEDQDGAKRHLARYFRKMDLVPPFNRSTEARHIRPLNPDGTCPAGFRKTRQGGRMICLLRMSEAVIPSGIHDHPHEPNGLHDHVGLPPATGGHRHELSPGSGAHAHREGDPLEGFHLGDPSDEGAHVHILAQKENIPELFKWYESVVDAHWPTHVWLPNHAATWVAVRLEGDDFSEPRQTTREDWQGHCLWAMHSAGANLQQHLAVHLDPMTRFLRLWYEMEDGTMTEATADDFQAEMDWLDSNLPFPDALVREALGAPATSQTA